MFITCSCLYAFLLVIICLAFLTSEVVTDNSPLHYYEGFFSFLYLLSIFFLFYVFCYLLHESTCCRADPEPATYFQVGADWLHQAKPVNYLDFSKDRKELNNLFS